VGIPDSDQYAEILDAASAGGYAYPAVNVTSSQTLNAVLRGFAEAGSDGIVQLAVSGTGMPSERLYTTTEDVMRVAEVLGTGE
jgi:fructose/tagatose bisphosphate aldolase